MNEEDTQETTQGVDQLQVLLIEDQTRSISAIQLMFSEIKECQLEVRHNFEDALLKLYTWEPDLVLLSHTIVKDKYLEVVRTICGLHPFTHLIMLLPSFDETLVEEYKNNGTHGFAYYDKSFLSGVISAIRKALLSIVEEKKSLLNAISRTSFFAEVDDSFDVLNLSMLEEGQIVLHYKIVREIGEGGMGQVYLSEDLKLGRQVAMKVLSPRVLKDKKARLRLVREARSASALNHPNIVTIYSIEETDELYFIVMEFVPGDSLWNLLKSGPFDLRKVLNIGIQIADALSAAHSAGLVHRDIKPANVMILPGGNVKLLDFGLAKTFLPSQEQQTGLTTDVTGIGVPVGTVSYMSPEQTRGEDLDARSDIWSLGAVLYESATGRLPFQAPSALGVMHEIATGELILPGKVAGHLPQGFDSIVRKAMSKKCEDRFATISEFSDALKHLKSSLERNSNVQQKTEARIFLVEDNDANRDMLSRRLQRRGFEVLVALNGEEGVQRIPVDQPDLVLMDISLPIMDGYEATRRLKADPRSKDIPIIALTAYAMPADKQKAIAAGCDDYDTKPVDFENLIKRIQLWLNKKQ